MSSPGFARLKDQAARGDREAAAVLVIVSHPRLSGKAEPFVDDHGVDFPAMLCAHDQDDADDGFCKTWSTAWYGADEVALCCKCGPYLSTGEHLMLTLAWNLWSGSRRNAVDVSGLLGTCDDGMVGVAFAAMEARRGSPLPTRVRAS